MVWVGSASIDYNTFVLPETRAEIDLVKYGAWESNGVTNLIV